MNTIHYETKHTGFCFRTCGELLKWNQSNVDDVDADEIGVLKQTAFYGRAGVDVVDQLFLLVYDSVVKADDPSVTYSGGAPVLVKEFVNITISMTSQ